MDLYNSIEKNKKEDDVLNYKKFASSAMKYSSQGFDPEMISELLQIDGCEKSISRKLASDAIDQLPEYYEEGPPISYEDVRDRVEKTILNEPLENIEEYFKNYAFQNLESVKRIAAVRVCPTQAMLNEIHKDLEPLIENIMISNIASVESGNFQKTSSKEEIEKNMFGVWPIEYLYEFKKRSESEKKILKKASERSEKPNILF